MHRYDLLEQVINERGYRRVTEVGVWHGETTRHLLKSCPSVEKYVCVDINISTMKPLVDDRLYKVGGESTKIAKIMPDEHFDLVFIDADHCYEAIINDINAWLPKMRKGGWFGGHDYLNPAHRWCEKAINDYFPKEKIKFNENCLVWWVEMDGTDYRNSSVDPKKHPKSVSSVYTQGYPCYE